MKEKQILRLEKEKERISKLYTYENAAREAGYSLIAGIDEAGRGPLAGPVSVAAVILPPHIFMPYLNDSKKVTPKRREILFEEIKEKAIAWSCILIDVETIDRLNILEATKKGMREALSSLRVAPDAVLIDAVSLSGLSIPSRSIIKGDAKSASIAAASIIAKVTRDRLMEAYDKEYPGYGFARHKGYGTAAHLEALKRYGPCPIHRKSFAPVRKYLTEERG